LALGLGVVVANITAGPALHEFACQWPVEEAGAHASVLRGAGVFFGDAREMVAKRAMPADRDTHLEAGTDLRLQWAKWIS